MTSLAFTVMSYKLLIVLGVVTGSYLGNIVSFPLSGVLCQYGFDGGWPSVFYLFGKQTVYRIVSEKLM